jgi:hypothetical protein
MKIAFSSPTQLWRIRIKALFFSKIANWPEKHQRRTIAPKRRRTTKFFEMP